MSLLAPIRADSGFSFPLLVYTAPNALFLLAAFFLLVRFEEYTSYTYLYIAGKAMAIAANLGWFFFSLQKLSPALIQQIQGTLSVLGFLLFLASFDALSILGMSALVMHVLGRPKADSNKAAAYYHAGEAAVPATAGLGLPAADDAGAGVNPETEEQ